MASSNNDRVRFRYGMCLNDSCSKAKAKEVQEIASRKEFVCAECGKPLKECPPPKKGGKKKPIVIIAAVVVGVVAVLAVVFSGGDKTPVVPDTPKDTTVVTPTPQPDSEPIPEPEPTPDPDPAPVSDNVVVTKDFGYAVYKGRMKGGKMNDDNGVLTFKEAHIIESRDVKKRMAQPGEKVIGIFEDGHLVTGTWHKNDGNKETIIP